MLAADENFDDSAIMPIKTHVVVFNVAVKEEDFANFCVFIRVLAGNFSSPSFNKTAAEWIGVSSHLHLQIM